MVAIFACAMPMRRATRKTQCDPMMRGRRTSLDSVAMALAITLADA